MLTYKSIDVYTSEEIRYQGQPLPEAILAYIGRCRIAARCQVMRGVAGCNESGEVCTKRLEVLSYNLPVLIRIILPEAEVEQVLLEVQEMTVEGIVTLSEVNVVSHRVRNAFFPRSLKVRDAMTPEPKHLVADSLLSEAAALLLSSIFSGLPVLDARRRPIGILTQGDLVGRGGMPLRLGLLAESDAAGRTAVLKRLATHTVAEAMTSPAITIAEDALLTLAVETMLAKGIKRLPVVDADGRLVGMLSRLDVFKTVMRKAPDWSAFKAQRIDVGHLRCVGDIVRRDVQRVAPDTSIEKVIQVIDRDDIQRVAVVDESGQLLGLISDRDVLRYLQPRHSGAARFFEILTHPLDASHHRQVLPRSVAQVTAADVMAVGVVTVHETMVIAEAIELMVSKQLKRLPVVDDSGHFKGMISRDALLRTGFQAGGDLG